MSCVKQTKELVDVASKMATHNSLIELGKQIEKKEQQQKIQTNRREELVKEIMSLEHQNVPRYVSRLTRENWAQWIIKFQEYVEMNEDIHIKLLQETTASKDDLDTLNDEMDELVKECDSKDTEITSLKIAHDKRVLNLRNKCIQRNNTILQFKFLLIISNLITLYVATVGPYAAMENMWWLFCGGFGILMIIFDSVVGFVVSFM